MKRLACCFLFLVGTACGSSSSSVSDAGGDAALVDAGANAAEVNPAADSRGAPTDVAADSASVDTSGPSDSSGPGPDGTAPVDAQATADLRADSVASCTTDTECGAGAYCRGLLNRCGSDCQFAVGVATAAGTCHRSCVATGCECSDDTDCP